MSGADKNGLVNNTQWLIRTYNLNAQAAPAQPKKPVNASPFKAYKETMTPFYFAKVDWEKPIMAIDKHLATEKVYDSPDMAMVKLALSNHKAFDKTTEENKLLVA